MKINILKVSMIIFLFGILDLKAQDTIYKKNKETLIGKVVEISPTEIKYKAWNNPDGPVIVVYSTDIYKIKYQNGTETVITPDPYALNQEGQIINKVQAVKFGFFSPLNNSICIGYEKMLKVGTNIEGKIAYIGAGYNETSYQEVSGSYGKIGIKFLVGQDFYINGLRYIHPFKGRYIKAEFSYAYFVIKNVEFSYSQNPYNYGYNSWTQDKTNINVSTGALNIIYGRQFILGNVMTLDYFAGVGYGIQGVSYSNKNYEKSSYIDYNGAVSNSYAFTYFTRKFPLTFTAGLSLGVLF